jgi:hypothetical protein
MTAEHTTVGFFSTSPTLQGWSWYRVGVMGTSFENPDEVQEFTDG